MNRIIQLGSLATWAMAFTLLLTACSSPDEEIATTVQSETQSETVSGEVSNAAASQEAVQDNAPKEQSIVKEALSDLSPEARLGARLFYENRLSNPGANLATSCRSCHISPEVSNGTHLFSDSRNFSIMPANASGGKVVTKRNTPTLMDATLQESYNADGAFDSLDTYLTHKLASPHMGWATDQTAQAMSELFALLLNDQGEDLLSEGSYIEQFKAVKGVDLETIDQAIAMKLVVESLTDYLATLTTKNTAAWDAFDFLNRFNDGLAGPDDTPQALSGRIFGRIANQEGRVLIRFPNVYNEEAYQGFKTFMRIEPTWNSSVLGDEINIGNCIACHVPPKFSDLKFYNTGVAQEEYDGVHGEGSFAALNPGKPSDDTRAKTDMANPGAVDLGRWNVVAAEKNLGAFKTPMLRNIEKTGPYMHNGAYDTLEDVIRHKIRISELAKAGKLRNAPPEYLTMNLSETDVPQLAAFLRTLTEVDPEKYRDFRIENVRIRQDILKGEQTYDN